MSGEIPAELGSLSNLERLDLSDNQLSGVPPELGSLSNLERLDLSDNQLSGVPPELGSLSNLTHLYLHDNQLSGEIPSELGSLSNLEWLWLQRNQLSGEIPAELGSLSNLERLDLSDNQLTGPIPASLGGLANLERLSLSQNMLTGCVPEAWRDIAESDVLELGLPFCAVSLNTAPVFSDSEGNPITEAVRSVVENTAAGENVGAPVTAMDADNDTLTYSLGGTDMASFDIDPSTGQIMVGAGTMLDYETKASYMVTVTATDPDSASDMITVTITVTNVDELGMVTGDATADYAEDRTDAVATYTADGPLTAAWSVSGADMDDFDINGGMLTFKASPDFETPTDADEDNVYQVTVQANAGGEMGMVDVTVTVTNVDEDGTVTLSSMQPVVDTMLTATLDDLDGGITGTTWQWASSGSNADDATWTNIDGATMASYTPVEVDVGMYLQATARYTDGHGSGKSEMAVSANMVSMASTNTAPMFPDTENGAREVAENTAAGEDVGAPVTAMDADNDTLTYSLGGTDMASFDIDPSTGQIMVGAGTMLDYETKASYMVTVTATDPDSASDMITVPITVTNEEETGEVTLWAGMDALTMAPQVGDTITGAVMDPDGGVMGESWQWSRTMDAADMNSWMPISGATDAAYTVTEGDTGYYLRVMATYTDAVGTDTAMEYSMPTMMVGAEAGGLTAMEPEPTQITFSWTAPSDNGGAPITAYDLRHIETGAADKSDANWTVEEDAWTTGSGSLQYTLTGLTSGTQYDVQVRAVNAAGTSAWSATVTGTTTSAVTGGDPLVARYDANDNGTIEKGEVIAAINDYLFGEGDEAISKSDVIKLINLYLFG